MFNGRRFTRPTVDAPIKIENRDFQAATMILNGKEWKPFLQLHELKSVNTSAPENETVDTRNYLEQTANCDFSASGTDLSVLREYGYAPIEAVLIVFVLSSFIFLAVAGNVLVIVAILTDRHLRKTSNFFIVSLAVADTLVALLVMTFSVANEVLGQWIFGAVFCNIWISSDVMCSTASIMNLCAISLDRYFHIRYPLHYDTLVTRNRTLGVIAVIWILSALISFLPIHLGWHRLGGGILSGTSEINNISTSVTQNPRILDFRVEDCAKSINDWNNINNENGDHAYFCALDLSPTYAVASSLVSFYLPCILMISVYVKLYQYARLHVKNIRAMTSITSPTITTTTTTTTSNVDVKTHSVVLGPPSANFAKTKKMAVTTSFVRGYSRATSSTVLAPAKTPNITRRSPTGGDVDCRGGASEHKAAVTLGVIMGVFLLCWAPFFSANVFGACCPTCVRPVVFSIFTWLGYMNSTMNPIIYSIFNKEFCHAFKRVLRPLYRCVTTQREETTLLETAEVRRQERIPLKNCLKDNIIIRNDSIQSMKHVGMKRSFTSL